MQWQLHLQSLPSVKGGVVPYGPKQRVATLVQLLHDPALMAEKLTNGGHTNTNRSR